MFISSVSIIIVNISITDNTTSYAYLLILKSMELKINLKELICLKLYTVLLQ